MQFFLSWKHKFRLLLILTLFGLAVMALSAYWANRQLNDSFQARLNATDYQGASIDLMNDWLKLASMRKSLTPAVTADYQRQTAAFEQRAKQFARQSLDLHEPSIIRNANAIEQLLLTDTSLQKNWLSLYQQLGLTPFDGQRQLLGSNAEALEAITISLIQPYIATALSSQRDYLSTYDPAYAAKTKDAVAQLQKQISELGWQDNQIGQSVAHYSQTFDRVDGLITEIRRIEERLATQGLEVSRRIDEQNELLQRGILASTALRVEQVRSSAGWILGVAFIGVSTLLLITLSAVSRNLMAQLYKIGQQLSQVAAGDLSGTLSLGRNPKDEFNQLGSASNRMTLGIAGLIRQVVDGNHQLNQLHAYLSHAMQQLAGNSALMEEQTEQIASATQQIAVTVNEMAQRASDVGESTHRVYASARSGAEIIGNGMQSTRRLAQLIQTTHTQVAQLSESSSRVSGIVGVINGLAVQTNLLALNAAIEAARAGEAGRGFSVVADEVRSLAQKTVTATRDIAQIIDELKRQTQGMAELMIDGLSLAAEGEDNTAQVAHAIDGITGSMEQLTAEMNQVVVAIEEISSTTEDIAGKMESISQHTGETKSLRLTLDGHARSLADQVEALNHSAGQFRID
jgi:methyl-accepting chemotaxis protein